MTDNTTTTTATPATEKPNDVEESVEKVFAEFKAQADAREAALKAQIEKMRVEHAKAVRDMLTGMEEAKRAQAQEQTTAHAVAEKVARMVRGRVKNNKKEV